MVHALFLAHAVIIEITRDERKESEEEGLEREGIILCFNLRNI
jgi:hypothetical protein